MPPPPTEQSNTPGFHDLQFRKNITLAPQGVKETDPYFPHLIAHRGVSPDRGLISTDRFENWQHLAAWKNANPEEFPQLTTSSDVPRTDQIRHSDLVQPRSAATSSHPYASLFLTFRLKMEQHDGIKLTFRPKMEQHDGIKLTIAGEEVPWWVVLDDDAQKRMIAF